MSLRGVENFNAALRIAERNVVAEAAEAIRSIGQELYAELVDRAADRSEPGGSPVASGRYAASFRVGINGIDSSSEDAAPGYRYPPASVHKYNANNLPRRIKRNVPAGRVAAALRAFKLGDTIFISNSVPYVRKIETGGHSWQTPQGVFEVTVRHVGKKFRNARIRVLNG